MKHHGATEQEAVKMLNKIIDDKWKDINEECLNPTPAPVPLLMVILNLTRMLDVLYKGKDLYTFAHGKIKDIVTALLITPFPI